MKTLQDLASSYVDMFIFGANEEKQLKVFAERNKIFKMREDHTEYEINQYLKNLGFDSDSEINLLSVHQEVFRRSRGRFEKERDAVECDLKFWYEFIEDKK